MKPFYSLLGLSLIFVIQLLAFGKNKQPNVLFIALDDMRPELNCYGESQIISPNIDQLAQEGLTLTRAYCQQAVCGPSRLSLMTGAHLQSLGVYGMSARNKIEYRDTRTGFTSLSGQFRKHGYFSACFGKIYDYRLGQDVEHSWDLYHGGRTPHFLDPKNKAMEKQWSIDRKAKRTLSVRRPAVECYEAGDEDYTDGWQAQEAIKFLHERDDSKPFFLAVGFVKPHLPFVAPKKYWDLYDRDSIDLPTQVVAPEDCSEYTISTYKEVFDYEVKTPITQDVVKELRHGYMACVSYVDALVGKLVSAVDELGELDNTIIVVWGDHGFKLGDFGEWAKHTNLETDTRVPLLFWIPNRVPRQPTSDSIVELVDVMPTLCDAVGIPIPESVDGHSLLPLFENPDLKIHEFALSHYPRGKDVIGYSIRLKDWRYTEWVNRKTGATLDQELYAIEKSGLWETQNVAKANPEKVNQFSKQLHEYLDHAPKWQGKPHM